MAWANKKSVNRGSVFILSLWILLAMSVYAIGLSETARQNTLVYQRLSGREAMRDMLEASVKKCILDIQDGNANKTAIWYKPNLYSQTVSSKNGTVRLEIEDVSERLNINKAEAYVLKNLIMESAGLDEPRANKLAYAIIDFRDGDDAVAEFFNRGSEEEAYLSAGWPHKPKNELFDYSAELLQVLGMTKEIYEAIKNYITIYGNGTLNINTVSKKVLVAVDLPPYLADKIIKVRDAGGEGSESTLFFKQTQTIASDLSKVAPLSNAERDALAHAIEKAGLRVDTGCYKIKASAALMNSNTAGRAACVYSLEDGILEWVEY